MCKNVIAKLNSLKRKIKYIGMLSHTHSYISVMHSEMLIYQVLI